MTTALLTSGMALIASAQEQPQAQQAAPVPQPELSKAPDTDVKQERWNLFYQATSIGQYHGTFRSPYDGPFSLQDTMERDVSLTTTLSSRPSPGEEYRACTSIRRSPVEGDSAAVNGLANSSNGELPRVASATPKPYVARLYVSHDFAFGS